MNLEKFEREILIEAMAVKVRDEARRAVTNYNYDLLKNSCDRLTAREEQEVGGIVQRCNKLRRSFEVYVRLKNER
jgi:K+/H+ antiporter YhaU regulatory subunit KhtT